MSSSSTSSKRKAPDSPMGPPGGRPEKKKQRSPLESKWETLRSTLTELLPHWEDYDGGHFMATMHHLRNQVEGVTTDEIAHHIETKNDLYFLALDTVASNLQGESPSTGSQPLEGPHLYQQNRNAMRDYVRRVRGCLEGQS